MAILEKIRGTNRNPVWPSFSAATESKPFAQMDYLEHCRALQREGHNVCRTVPNVLWTE